MKKALIIILVLTSSFLSAQIVKTYPKDEVPLYDFISVGVGIPAISVNAGTRDMGFMNSVSPLSLMWTPQRAQVPAAVRENSDGTREYINSAWYTFSIGLLLQKPEDSDIVAGLTLIPYMYRIGDYALGIGAQYIATGKVEFVPDNLSVIIPVTYSF